MLFFFVELVSSQLHCFSINDIIGVITYISFIENDKIPTKGAGMVPNEELLLFMRDVYSLICDYKKSENENIKNQIYQEIQLLSEIIKS